MSELDKCTLEVSSERGFLFVAFAEQAAELPKNTVQPFETLLSFYLHLDAVQCVSEGKRRGCAGENKHWTRSHFLLGREDNDGNQICAENSPRTFLAEILRRLPALAATICNDNENIRLMRHLVLFFFSSESVEAK